MLKRHEIPILLTSIFILILTMRFLFHFTYVKEFEAGEVFEFEHILLSQPHRNEFQQYFYVDNLLVTLPLYPQYGYGDNLRLKGNIETYISNTDESMTEKLILKNPKVEIEENRTLAVFKYVRQKVLLAYKSSLPPRESGLLSGIVLGVEDGIKDSFKEELKRSGMLHVVVASGSNIVLVAGIIFIFIKGLVKKRIAIVFTILGIFFYAFLTGFDPPIVRASLMASFAFSAMVLGRERIALISLFFSAWLMLMFMPQLISDIGFQLSFSASFGIIMFQKVIELSSKFIPKILKEDFSTTLSAQIGAMPILLFAFGEINILSIMINVLLLWSVPIIMIMGLMAGVLGLLAPQLASPILFLLYPLLLLFSEVVKIGANLYIPLSLDTAYAPIAVIYYLILVFMLSKLKFKNENSS